MLTCLKGKTEFGEKQYRFQRAVEQDHLFIKKVALGWYSRLGQLALAGTPAQPPFALLLYKKIGLKVRRTPDEITDQSLLIYLVEL